MREPTDGSAVGVTGVAPLSIVNKSQFPGQNMIVHGMLHSQAWGWRIWYFGEVEFPAMAERTTNECGWTGCHGGGFARAACRWDVDRSLCDANAGIRCILDSQICLLACFLACLCPLLL